MIYFNKKKQIGRVIFSELTHKAHRLDVVPTLRQYVTIGEPYAVTTSGPAVPRALELKTKHKTLVCC